MMEALRNDIGNNTKICAIVNQLNDFLAILGLQI